MRQEHQQTAALALRQRLSQSARQRLELVVMPPMEFAEYLERQAEENPFLSVSRTTLRGHAGHSVSIAAQQPGLFAHVLAELPFLVKTAADLPIAVRLAEGLDERGFLVDTVTEIAADLTVPLARVEEVLALVQGIEPAGLFARTVAESLGLQLRALGGLNEMAIRLLCDLDGLATDGPERFAHRHGLDLQAVNDWIRRLAMLRRNPASALGEAAPAVLSELLFERSDGVWTVQTTLQSTTQLSLRAKAFTDAMNAAEGAEEKQRLRRLWRDAQALHQAASLRDTTLAELGKQLVQHQGPGLDSGLTALAPLTQRQMAEWLSVHESTISKVVRHRFASVEGQVVPLSRFFERPRRMPESGPRTRSVALCALRELLESERMRGKSDRDLVEELAVGGIQITRRRLAKYRGLLGIPSSRQRRKRSMP